MKSIKLLPLLIVVLLIPAGSALAVTVTPWISGPSQTFAHAFTGAASQFHLGPGDSPFDLATNGCPLGGSYIINFWVGDDPNIYTDNIEANMAGYGATVTTYDCPWVTSFETRIDTVTPPMDFDGSLARATSTTFAFEATGYVNLDDFISPDSYISQKWTPNDYDQLAVALCAVGGCGTEYRYPLISAGPWSVATTTDVQRPGWYTLNTIIYVPHQIFGVSIPFWNNPIVATSTQFLVATSSPIDNIKRSVGGAVEDIINGQESPTRYCNFSDILSMFDFNAESNILTCLLGVITGLTVPNGTQAQAIANNFNVSVATRPPFGYFTRFIALAQGSAATSTLPSFVLSFPSGYGGGLDDVSVNLTPWNYLLGPTSIWGTATSSAYTGSKTLRQIIEPGIWIIASLLLALAIVFDVLRMKHHV